MFEMLVPGGFSAPQSPFGDALPGVPSRAQSMLNLHLRIQRGGFALASMFVPLLLAATLSGCGGDVEDPFERVPVQGTVTVGGEPVQYGLLQLTGEKNEKTQETAFVSAQVRDGKFAVKDGATTPGPNEAFLIIYASEPKENEEVKTAGTWNGTVTVEPEKDLKIEIDPTMLSRS
jgi:hypothetical protein